MNEPAITTATPTEVTKSDVFQPTPHMKVWLDTAMQLESDSITDIAEACNISRKTWYDWINNPEFINWFNTTWNERLRGHAWKLDVIGMKQGKRDFNYWKAMQQRVGNLQDKPQSLQQFNVNGEMSLEFTDKK